MDLSNTDRLLLTEAGFWLGVARLAILFLPFRWIKVVWGEEQAMSAANSGETSPELLDRVSWAVATASRNIPWDCLCLAQAMAGRVMLRCRGIPSTLYLGLAKEGTTQLQGHAWLKCGEQILTGQQGVDKFTVIATFTEDGN